MDNPGPACTGSPSYNLLNPSNTWNEWPENISGLVCKTPPIGYYSSSNFAKCCSGEVYNITEPVPPDHPFYPVSCAMLCLIDPKIEESNEKYPYTFSEHFMCLNDFPEGEDTSGYRNSGEVVCATVTASGVPAPTSFASTPTGAWQTKSYSDWGYGREMWDSSAVESVSESTVTVRTTSQAGTQDQSSQPTVSGTRSGEADELSPTESADAAESATETPSTGPSLRMTGAKVAYVVGCVAMLSIAML